VDIALFPKDCSESLTAALAVAGIDAVGVEAIDSRAADMAGDWSLLVVELGDEPMKRLRHIEELAGDTGLPVLVVAEAAQFALLEKARGMMDLIVHPPDPAELGLRVRRLVMASVDDDVLRFGDLILNLLTYQAMLDGEAIDLTFMEYELLRFFVEHKGRVWSREQLLSKVWGYDYYGGARTVDVHVRRLRAKLGEERAGWITTVRSVGYRFG